MEMERIEKTGKKFLNCSKFAATQFYLHNSNPSRIPSLEIDPESKTLLHHALEMLREGRVSTRVVEELYDLEKECLGRKLSDTGETPYHWAARRGGGKQCLQWLWGCQIRPGDIRSATRDKGWKPLHYAARFGRADCAEFIAGRARDTADSRDATNGDTPFLLACREPAGLPCFDVLRKFSDKSATDHKGRTWGHLAVMQETGRDATGAKDINIRCWVKEHGMPLEAYDSKGLTPFHLALITPHCLGLARTLIKL